LVENTSSNIKNNKERDKDNTRINESIRSREVRLIDAEGEMLGVMTIKDALQKAYDTGLDLVEISPEGNPPVCKLMDYGKYKFSQQKKKQEAKKKQKVIILKELYIHLNIAQHDYNVKLKKVIELLSGEYKVKIGVKLRGREMDYRDKALELLNRFYDDMGKENGAKLETSPKMEGNNAIVIFAPLTIKLEA
jgi:translation initiation factor IF-3